MSIKASAKVNTDALSVGCDEMMKETEIRHRKRNVEMKISNPDAVEMTTSNSFDDSAPLLEDTEMIEVSSTSALQWVWDTLSGRCCFSRLLAGLKKSYPRLEHVLNNYPEPMVVGQLQCNFEANGINFMFGRCSIREEPGVLVIIIHEARNASYLVHPIQESKVLNPDPSCLVVEYHVGTTQFVCQVLPKSFEPITKNLMLYYVGTPREWFVFKFGAPKLTAICLTLSLFCVTTFLQSGFVLRTETWSK